MLERYDNVFIRSQPGWELQRTVQVSGEVRFPGSYALERKGEGLRELIERAGGLTPDAYPEGVRFFRRQQVVGASQGQRTRVNVDLRRMLEDPSPRNEVILADGDSIHIPEYIPTVLVEGAVLFPTSVMYKQGAGLDYYVSSAGGYAREADKGRSRVEFANGSVRTVSSFLLFKSKPDPGPGSRVFVPGKPPRRGGPNIPWAALLTSITTIVVVIAAK